MTLVELVSSDVAKPVKTKKTKKKTADKPVVADTQTTKTEPAAVSETGDALDNDRPDEGADIKTAPTDTKSDIAEADDAPKIDAKASTDPGGTNK